jgi:hypothetical protein
MKVRNFLKYALAGLLLTTAPVCAFAQVVPSISQESTGTILDISGATSSNYGVGIQLNGPNAGTLYYNGAPTGAQRPVLNNVLTINDVTINASGVSANTHVGTAGVLIDNLSNATHNNTLVGNTINAGAITVNGTDSVLMAGFAYVDETGGATSAGFNASTLNLNDINVINTSNTLTAITGGIGFMARSAAGDTAAHITGTAVRVNNINVSGVNAVGFAAQNLVGGASINIAGNVTVNDNGKQGNNLTAGINLTQIGDGNLAREVVNVAGDINVTSSNAIGGSWGFRTLGGLNGATVNLGNINVVSSGNDAKGGATGNSPAGANGISIGNHVLRSQFNNSTFTAKDVNVTATGAGNAYGITVTEIAGNNSSLNVGNITTTAAAANAQSVNANNIGATNSLTVGDVSATVVGTTGNAVGINANQIAGSLVAGDVNVNANGGTATGVALWDRRNADNGFTPNVGNITATGSLTVGKVNVNSTNSAATGINLLAGAGAVGNGDVAGTFTTDDLNVTSGTGNAIGINAGIIAQTGSFNANDVNVKATNGNATGISVARIVAPAAGAPSNFNVGNVKVSSTGSAIGIDVRNNAPSTFTISNDVIATSTAAHNPGAGAAGTPVVGIQTDGGQQNLTINTNYGDVQISGVSAISGNTSIDMRRANDTLNISGKNAHTNKGKQFNVDNVESVNWTTDAKYVSGSGFRTNVLGGTQLTTHTVANNKTVVIDGNVTTNGGNYTFGSTATPNNNTQGTLAMQGLYTNGGNVIVNNGLLALDGNYRSSVGNLTIGGGANIGTARVALYGNAAPGTAGLLLTGSGNLPPTMGTNGVGDAATGERVLSMSTITEYRWNANGTAGAGYYARNRQQAALADGFLLPAAIHNRIAGWEATRDHLISATRGSRSGREYLGQAPCDPCSPVAACDPCAPCNPCEPQCDPCAPSCEPDCDEGSCDPCDPCNTKHRKFARGFLLGSGAGRSAWVNYIGRSSDYRSSYSNIGIANGDWQIGTDGVQVGLDLYKSQRSQLGLLFGYEGTKATSRSDQVDADDVYFGVYAARVFSNGADFRLIYNYGSQDYTMRRLDPGLGFDWHLHNAAFDGNTHELNLELGKRVFSNRRLSYRPVIGFDLVVNSWDGAAEDGNLTTAIVYGDSDLTQAFLRFGSDMKYNLGRLEFNSGLYYSYDLNGDRADTKVFAKNRNGSANRNVSSTLYGSDLGRSVLTFNVGGTYALSNCTTVFGGFTGDSILDRDGDGFQSVGYVGLQWQW